MKKLFATFLMLTVALSGWSQLSRTSWDSATGTLTINYAGGEITKPQLDALVADGPNGQKGKVQKLVLTGVWSNGDINTEDFMKFIKEKCLDSKANETKTLYLDLSACENIVCKVEYTGTGNPDYATKNFKYVYSTDTEPITVTKDVAWVEENGNIYTGSEEDIKSLQDGNVTKYYYSALYETGQPYNNQHKLLTDNNGTYYHLFYDGSSGTPTIYSGAYQAPDNDLPALDSDADGYYFIQYFDGENLYQGDVTQLPSDANGYYTSLDYYRDGTKVNSWELSNYTQENGHYYYWDFTDNDGYLDDNANNPYVYNGLLQGQEPGGYQGTGWNADHTVYTWVSYDGDHKAYTFTRTRKQLEERKHYLEAKKYHLEERKYYLEERMTFVEQQTVWYYTEVVNGSTVKKYVNSANVTATSDTEGTYNVAGGDALSFNKIGAYLNGVTFPNHENFTAIPDELCWAQDVPNLETVILGDNVEWIGNKAFFQSRNLKNVTYPNGNTSDGYVSFPAVMKAIGIDAFKGCWSFTNVNLNLSGLVRLDAAAFNMEDDTKNNLATVTLPTSAPNYTLKFWGNQVFASTKITKLDLENLYAIEHFAYDGYNSMGEGAGEGGTISPTATFTWMTSLEELRLPKNLVYAPGGNDENSGMCSHCTSLTTVVFTGEPTMEGCEIQNKVIIGEYCFRSLPLLSDIQLSDNIAEIYERAFDELVALERIEIPASVEELQAYSFNHCSNLTTVIFREKPESFGECDGPVTNVRGGSGEGAFYNCQAITDVYVNREEPALHCENYGFDFYITWGHGDASRALATLHVPKSHIGDYVNLSHYLTDAIVADPGEFHNWLMEHVQQAVVPHKNGWYEFINAGPTFDGPDEGLPEIMIRTFSDYELSYLVPDGLRAYVVNKVEKVGDNYMLSLQRLRVIPAKTGVILYGHPNGKNQQGNPALSMTPVEFAKAGDVVKDKNGSYITLEVDQGQPLCRANWGLLSENDMIYKNYLEPSFDENGNAMRIEPFAWDKATGTKVAWRNFGMNRYLTTRSLHTVRALDLENDEHDYVGFFRVLPKTHPIGYAYLHLTGDADDEGNDLPANKIEYGDGAGLEAIVIQDEDFHYEYGITDGKWFDARTNASQNPKKWWEINNPKHVDYDWTEWTLSWGVRPSRFDDPNAAPKFLGELEDTDGIVNVVVPAGNRDGGYYTLQGVRVINPTKGVYIHNGKKVIIK